MRIICFVKSTGCLEILQFFHEICISKLDRETSSKKYREKVSDVQIDEKWVGRYVHYYMHSVIFHVIKIDYKNDLKLLKTKIEEIFITEILKNFNKKLYKMRTCNGIKVYASFRKNNPIQKLPKYPIPKMGNHFFDLLRSKMKLK